MNRKKFTMQEYKKEWYQKNKERIKERKKRICKTMVSVEQRKNFRKR